MNQTEKYILAFGAYVAAIHAVKGPWNHWKRGEVVDMWTLTHIGWGMIAKKMGVPYRTFMWLGVANEVGEAIIRKARPDLLWGTPEGPWNIAADIATNHIGYRIG